MLRGALKRRCSHPQHQRTVILLRKLPVIGSVAAPVVKQRKSCSPEENLIITLSFHKLYRGIHNILILFIQQTVINNNKKSFLTIDGAVIYEL